MDLCARMLGFADVKMCGCVCVYVCVCVLCVCVFLYVCRSIGCVFINGEREEVCNCMLVSKFQAVLTYVGLCIVHDLV